MIVCSYIFNIKIFNSLYFAYRVKNFFQFNHLQQKKLKKIVISRF